MARSPNILVTGLGHSGTTYVMQLIEACGWDLGSPLFNTDERKGLEWLPLQRLSVEIGEALGRTDKPVRPDWNWIDLERREEVRQDFKERIEALDCPPVVKCPDFGEHAVLSLLKPGHVIFMQRSLDDWTLSMRGNAHARRNLTSREIFHAGALGMGLLLDALETQNIPYKLVNYPRVARDVEYAWDRLGAVLEVDREAFEGAHAASSRPDWIGWTERTLDTSGDMVGVNERLRLRWRRLRAGFKGRGLGALRRAGLRPSPPRST